MGMFGVHLYRNQVQRQDAVLAARVTDRMGRREYVLYSSMLAVKVKTPRYFRG